MRVSTQISKNYIQYNLKLNRTTNPKKLSTLIFFGENLCEILRKSHWLCGGIVKQADGNGLLTRNAANVFSTQTNVGRPVHPITSRNF